MAKKKSQKKIGGNYAGSRAKQDNSFGDKKRKTYMILSTLAIIFGLILTGWQSLGTSRSNVELAYSDLTTEIREMKEPVSAFAEEAAKVSGVAGDSIDAVNKAYADLSAAVSASERGEAAGRLSEALSAVYASADEDGLQKSAYKDAKETIASCMETWSETAADYNKKAESYNKSVTKFPMKLLALVMQYETVPLIEGLQ